MSLGSQLAAPSGDPILEGLCRASAEPVAVLDGEGAVRFSSPSFDAIAREDPEIPALLASSLGLASSGRRVLVERPMARIELAPIEGTLLVRVRVFGPIVVRSRLKAMSSPPLSTRESECIAIALEGRDNAAIAAVLGVRPETVKVHLRNAYRKLGTTGRTPLLSRMVLER